MSDALKTLDMRGVAYGLIRYAPGATAAEVAASHGLNLDAMLKTVAFAAGREVVLACVPIARRVDPTALAAQLGLDRVQPLDRGSLMQRTGFQSGQVTPVPGARRFRVVIDSAITAFPTVAVGAGAGVDVIVSPTDLIAVCAADVAAIAA